MNSYLITVNGKTYDVDVVKKKKGGVEITRVAPVAAPAPAPQAAPVAAAPAAAPAPAPAKPASAPAAASGDGLVIAAPLPGNVLKVNVNQGDAVKTGQALFVLEALKMENEIVSPKDGAVTGLFVKQGDVINTGDKMATIG